ncbi:MAG TPA: CCA tRNA nucleotidyltransferase [Gaiella sp.]|nr:CCA tRNA nucleotidyltransferase [Gaiella sp.]
MPTAIRRYIRSLGLDAYVVGGAVRDELLGIEHADEDFLVPGVDQAALRAALAPHGRVEDMEVHGQLVGVRFYPRDREVRRLVPAGIELTPPRAERSTGPGHRDFAIVAEPSVSIEDDMARRDFTVNAMARRLETGELVDPFGGLGDLEARQLRTVSPESFREDPLRILRGLRLVSQLSFSLPPETVERMRAEASGLRHVSRERIGGGLAADGMGELSKLLLGTRPRDALRIARDTGALVEILPEYGPTIGYDLGTPRQPVALDEHLFGVVQNASDAAAPLAVRLAALLHDLGKPEADESGADHAHVGARIAGRVLRRLRYPNTLREEVVRLVAAHAFRLEGPIDEVFARRFLASHGLDAARLVVAHKRADLGAKHVEPWELEHLEAITRLLEEQRDSPHRLEDLAVDGHDLISIGYREGPALGAELARLLDTVVDDPGANERETLLQRAREALA